MFLRFYFLKRYLFQVLLFSLVAIIVSCSHPAQEKKVEKPRISFKSIWGIHYTEVYRVFDNGLTFTNKGYQLEPTWRLTFLSDDSIRIYSPKNKVYVNLPITVDHDSVFNMAWAWLRLKTMNKDSVKLEVLKVINKEVHTAGPTVYMTLYSDDFIYKTLKSQPSALIKPSRKDSLFVREKASLFDHNFDSVFAARNPVILKSKSPLLSIKKLKPKGLTAEDVVIEDEYLSPEYDILIQKAYQDFNYSFSVIADKEGRMHFGESLVDMSPEFRDAKIRVMKAIIDGYLKLYLDIKPGNTLGIPHASKFIVNVKGVKS